MSAILNVLDRINLRLAQGIRWLAVAMVLATLAVVVLRYGFSIGAIPLQESVIYMHGVLFLIGIPYGVREDTHVRVDVLYSRMSPARKRWVNLTGHVIFLLPIAGFIFWTSLPYAAASWRVLEGSAEVGGLPAVFLLKTLLPISAALLFLQGVVEIGKLALSRDAAG